MSVEEYLQLFTLRYFYEIIIIVRNMHNKKERYSVSPLISVFDGNLFLLHFILFYGFFTTCQKRGYFFSYVEDACGNPTHRI